MRPPISMIVQTVHIKTAKQFLNSYHIHIDSLERHGISRCGWASKRPCSHPQPMRCLWAAFQASWNCHHLKYATAPFCLRLEQSLLLLDANNHPKVDINQWIERTHLSRFSMPLCFQVTTTRGRITTSAYAAKIKSFAKVQTASPVETRTTA